MELHEILIDIPYKLLSGKTSSIVSGLCSDSRQAGKDYAFFCLDGKHADGRSFIPDAYGRGARVFFVRAAIPQDYPDAAFVLLDDPRAAMGHIAARFFAFPANRFRLVGITGTKGKSSVLSALSRILTSAGHKNAVIGAKGVCYEGKTLPTRNITPDALELQRIMSEPVLQDCDFILLETTSQGLAQHRTAGLRFELGIFTNLTDEHVTDSYHRSLYEYAKSKAILFTQCDKALANAGCPFTPEVTEHYDGKVMLFGAGGDFYADEIDNQGFTYQSHCISHKIELKNAERWEINNALAALGAAELLGVLDDEKMSENILLVNNVIFCDIM